MPLQHEPARDASSAAIAAHVRAESVSAGQPAPPQPAASAPQPHISHHCFSDEAHDTVVHFQVSAATLVLWMDTAATVATLCSNEADVMVVHCPACALMSLPCACACLPAGLAVSQPLPTHRDDRSTQRVFDLAHLLTFPHFRWQT